ncbi:SDR family NAD(P)-dependent oxidoreductase [Acidocella aromatica]|uniref:NAD(P)-dependent dehydrogenase (Short-subunit alcohol dehydrogenase family) n=1 Tax=Acidocella aromatica TaxID=1303579 RepID=A0A840VJT7_9PROT|nr:NAD(P)-dependent dehydrogenase (short-subunit alcohol dehydrogenase family) [Acidocella aromatica]
MTQLGSRAAVFGATGAIGGALVRELAARGVERIYALSRRPPPQDEGVVVTGFADILDDASLAAAAERIGRDGALDTVIIATGILHAPGIMPEKALRDIQAKAFAEIFAVNCTGPALVMKHFIPLLPRHRPARLAVLSARVGSISDNRKGGWYAYRASKAALNMVVRSAAIETARRAPLAAIVALHPGTVDTPLSQPFQSFVPPGQLTTRQQAAQRLLDVLGSAGPTDSGKIIGYDGKEIPA